MARPLTQRPRASPRNADEDPARSELAGIEVVAQRADRRALRAGGALAGEVERPHSRPPVRAPHDRRKERLPAEMVVPPRRRADPEQDSPRAAVLQLDQVGVAGGLNRVARPVAVREQRPVGRRRERPVRSPAPRDHDRVPVARAALRGQEVVEGSPPVQVRRLGPDAPRAFPDRAWRTRQHELAVAPFELCLVDERVIAVGAWPVAGVVDAAVEECQRGIDSLGIKPTWIGPGAAWILGGDDEVAASNVGGDEIEGPVVVSQRRGVDAFRAAHPGQVELAPARQDVTELPPAHQVAAVEDRDPRGSTRSCCRRGRRPGPPGRRWGRDTSRAGPDCGTSRGDAQPLTAPESPPTMRRSAKRKNASAGIIESVVKARTPAVS